MPIFKFTSEKPSALKIWTTLIDTPIHPREGYTEDQIRYRMFVWLQLTSDFKTVVGLCNNIIDSPTVLLIALLNGSYAAADCKESDFSDLSVLSEAFPHWISSELYVPYYLTKMLCHNLNSFDLLLSLFDRTALLTEELDHWNIDNSDSSGLTAYKLLALPSTPVMDWITISYDRTPKPISSRQDIRDCILGELLDSIEVSDNFIIPEGAKTTIPYFILKASDASQ